MPNPSSGPYSDQGFGCWKRNISSYVHVMLDFHWKYQSHKWWSWVKGSVTPSFPPNKIPLLLQSFFKKPLRPLGLPGFSWGWLLPLIKVQPSFWFPWQQAVCMKWTQTIGCTGSDFGELRGSPLSTCFSATFCFWSTVRTQDCCLHVLILGFLEATGWPLLEMECWERNTPRPAPLIQQGSFLPL